MASREDLAKIEELSRIATEALNKATKLAQEENIPFIFEVPKSFKESRTARVNNWNDSVCSIDEDDDEEADWETSDWDDSGCTS